MLRITITGEQMRTIRRYAVDAEIGGGSHIRSGEDRQANLSEDQLVGMLGEAAVSVWLTGSIWQWALTREAANRCPNIGDNGCDLIGLKNLDVKTSRMRHGAEPSRYHLLVRPRERHPEAWYVAAFVETLEETATVILTGWLRDQDLPQETAAPGLPWAGAHAVPVSSLKPLPPLTWISQGWQS